MECSKTYFNEPIIQNKTIEFPTLQEIYKNSIIDWEDYMDECVILSIKTSNNQEIIENMEFFKFRSLIRSLNKYLEAENKNNGNNEEGGDLMQQSKDMMGNAKNLLKGNKLPNFKKPNFK